jgi:hypothetical protein
MKGEKMHVQFCAAMTAAVLACAAAAPALADCAKLPNHAKLHDALAQSVKPSGGPSNGGLDLNMWASIVDRMVWFARSRSPARTEATSGRGAA